MHTSWYDITEREHRREQFEEAVASSVKEMVEAFAVRCTCGMPLCFDREIEGDNNMTIIVEPCPACERL